MQASQRDSHNTMVCVCVSHGAIPRRFLDAGLGPPRSFLDAGFGPYIQFFVWFVPYTPKYITFFLIAFRFSTIWVSRGWYPLNFQGRVRYPLDIKKVSVRIECVCVTIHHPRNEKPHSGRPRTCRFPKYFLVLAGSESIFTEIPGYKYSSLQ